MGRWASKCVEIHNLRACASSPSADVAFAALPSPVPGLGPRAPMLKAQISLRVHLDGDLKRLGWNLRPCQKEATAERVIYVGLRLCDIEVTIVCVDDMPRACKIADRKDAMLSGALPNDYGLAVVDGRVKLCPCRCFPSRLTQQAWRPPLQHCLATIRRVIRSEVVVVATLYI
jgi:hypothetical protein